MRQVSLREFRTRGSKALGIAPRKEPILLAGQQGPAYFLVPVEGDVVAQDRELCRAMARASLRTGWLLASAASPMDEDAINREIDRVRSLRKPRKSR